MGCNINSKDVSIRRLRSRSQGQSATGQEHNQLPRLDMSGNNWFETPCSPTKGAKTRGMCEMLQVIFSHHDEQDLLGFDSVTELLRIQHTVVAIEGKNLSG